MNRRTFFKSTGTTAAAAAASMMGAGAAHALESNPTGGGHAPERDAAEKARNRNRSTVVSQHGMVCASQHLATMAGIDVLKAGGNAIDAAVCANAMLGLVEPMNCGVGGDLFAILWIEKDKKLYGLNASGRSPYEWNLEEAAKLNLKFIPGETPLAWNVPGCVSGWGALLERFGTLPLGQLLDPAIRYAREGFPVTGIVAADWAVGPKYESLCKIFMPGGNAPKFGEIFTNPALADTLESIAKGGPRSFYEGEIADKIVAANREGGGRMSKKDFVDHQPEWVEPVSTTYRGYHVWEIPPNGQGISALQMLNMLEQFDIAALEPNSAEHLHLFIEAKKLAFEDRAVYYADPKLADVPLEWLIGKEYGKQRAALIDPAKAAQNVTCGKVPGGHDTIYMTAADGDGNMISLIQSIYARWGSRIVPGGLGFSMQNRGLSFSLNPNHRNKLEPHKRPFHTIIPAFVTRDGAPKFSFGVMGGDFQPQGHVQVLMNILDFGMSPQQAGDQPRAEHDGSSTPMDFVMKASGIVNLEMGIPDAVRDKLVEMGHKVTKVTDEAFGGYQAIWREENPRRYYGGSDPRKDGCAFGY
ncbi:MAG TPA: gamma-glutamyltransferase [Candidatus Bathyarchaeia archaeon]|nr:gamma-glutamyltransferase [Candidatus Bathyarchaeia archaeon]